MNSLADILSHKPHEYQKQKTENDTAGTQEAGFQIPTPTQAEKDHARLEQLKTIVYSMRDSLDAMLRLLSGEQVARHAIANPDTAMLPSGERVIEGVFNGEKMVGSDGKEYAVPPNYASKSKLVEGDLLKLTMTNRGAFIFKQIGPIKRRRIMGELVANDESDRWQVLSAGRLYNILTASVTFYKGKSGEEVVMLVPEDGESQWGAVENIIHPPTFASDGDAGEADKHHA